MHLVGANACAGLVPLRECLPSDYSHCTHSLTFVRCSPICLAFSLQCWSCFHYHIPPPPAIFYTNKNKRSIGNSIRPLWTDPALLTRMPVGGGNYTRNMYALYVQPPPISHFNYRSTSSIRQANHRPIQWAKNVTEIDRVYGSSVLPLEIECGDSCPRIKSSNRKRSLHYTGIGPAIKMHKMGNRCLGYPVHGPILASGLPELPPTQT